jgi:hypothetical protein
MTRRAGFPLTGPTGTAAKRQADAQAALDDRNAAKRAAALRNPGADTFAQNAARARREGWSDGTMKDQHKPGQ